MINWRLFGAIAEPIPDLGTIEGGWSVNSILPSQSTLSCIGRTPRQSHLTYPVTAVTTKDMPAPALPVQVPEPHTAIALSVGAGTLGCTRRHRKHFT